MAAQRSSNFIAATRERDNWITTADPGSDPREAQRLLGTAALVRGTLEGVTIPEGAEEASRARCVDYMNELRVERLNHQDAQAPWYLKIGSTMRYVFTLGKKR
jgi:hypothetical protein